MKAKLFTLIVLALCVTGFYSCEDDDKDVKKTEVTLNIEKPEGYYSFNLKSWKVTLTEMNSGRSYKAEGETNIFTMIIPEGDYSILAQGTAYYQMEENSEVKEGEFRVAQKSLIAVGERKDFTLKSLIKPAYEGDGGFVIEEIYYTGSVTPEGKQYSGDKYIKLYNNTDKTLYADGLFIATTMLNTGIAYTYIPDIVDKFVPVDGIIIIIPGNGTQYPVEPGKSFILTESAVNHKEGNLNSVDLSKANMEWVNPNLINQPADNPNVPNAKDYIGNFLLHNSGLTSMIIGRLEVSEADYLTDYVYEYYWKTIINGVEYQRGPFQDFKIPNEWVMDAVYTSVEGRNLRSVFSYTIDMDWTYCGSYFGDKDRYGKSVRRKVLEEAKDGRKVLQDTNNSRSDFTPNATPSLME
ncbi:MAG: DUF4876 domain-containing protein [Dysgonomonas sp.]